MDQERSRRIQGNAMIEQGRIVEIRDGKATIELLPQGGCRSCAMNNLCRTTGKGKRVLVLDVQDRKLKTGQSVDIETPARNVLAASFLVFIMPLIVATAGYAVVQSLFLRTDLAIAGFFGFFVLAELAVAVIDRWVARRSAFQPCLVRIIDSPGESPKSS
jgi:positive regulator of sigma E activity